MKNLTASDRKALTRQAAVSGEDVINGIARAWVQSFKKVLDAVPDDVLMLAGSVDAEDAYTDLQIMLTSGKGPKRELVEKNPRLADKLEALESDMWFEGVLDRWDLDDLGLDEDELRENLQIELSEALVKAGLVGKKFRLGTTKVTNMKSVTASDRKALIRLASTMDKGSPERRAVLAGLTKVAASMAKHIRALQKMFPKSMVESTEAGGWGSGGIWTSFGEEGISNYQRAGWPDEHDAKLTAYMDKHGLYGEWNDPGTLMIYSSR